MSSWTLLHKTAFGKTVIVEQESIPVFVCVCVCVRTAGVRAYTLVCKPASGIG